MLVNGSLGELMAMESILGLMAIDMKGNLKNVWSMVKEYKNLPMEIYTKVFMQMENHQDLVNIIGQMGVTLKEHSKTV